MPNQKGKSAKLRKQTHERKTNMRTANYATAMAALMIVADSVNPEFSALNITSQDLKVLTDNTPWVAQQKESAIRTVQALTYGISEMQGVSRLTVPAEYMAAVIAVFVKPCNYFAACTWVAERKLVGSDVTTMATGEELKETRTTAQQLFALTISLGTGEVNEARTRFEKRMSSASKTGAKPSG